MNATDLRPHLLAFAARPDLPETQALAGTIAPARGPGARRWPASAHAISMP
jgi:hypothetical protein